MAQQEIVNTVGNRYVLLDNCVFQSWAGQVQVYRAYSYKTKHAGFIARCRLGDEYVCGPMVPVRMGPDIPENERRTRSMAMGIALKRATNCVRARLWARHAHSDIR